MPTKGRAGKKSEKQAASAASRNASESPPKASSAQNKLKQVRPAPNLRLPWRWWSQACVALVVVFFGLIRVRLLQIPLERDEGEYAYAGQLILQGIAPYRYCYTMKLPGTAAAYALLTAAFGQTAVGVHLGLLLVNSATTVMVYFLARRLFGRLAGAIASATFAFLSLEPSVLGFAGHATQFVLLPAIAGTLLLLKAIETGSLRLFFCCGLSLGASFLMKQPGIFFVLFAVFYLSATEWVSGLRWARLTSRMSWLLAGAALPFALTCLIMFAAGEFSRFRFWTFSYANQYGNLLKLGAGLEVFLGAVSNVMASAFLLWIIAGLGILAVLWSPKARIDGLFSFGFLAFSLAAVCPGFYFRPHYFVLLLPAVSLLCGAAVGRATALVQQLAAAPWWAWFPSLAFAIALGVSVLHDGEPFFREDPAVICKRVYGNSPFLEAPVIAEFIRSRSAKDDRIAVIGSEPEIYFYSHLLSATGYIYTYSLTEPQPFAASMQREMETEIEAAMPRFVVIADVPTSWFSISSPKSDLGILSWAEQFVRDHYQLVGVADLLDQGTKFHWDADARSYQTESKFRVLIFQRR